MVRSTATDESMNYFEKGFPSTYNNYDVDTLSSQNSWIWVYQISGGWCTQPFANAAARDAVGTAACHHVKVPWQFIAVFSSSRHLYSAGTFSWTFIVSFFITCAYKSAKTWHNRVWPYLKNCACTLWIFFLTQISFLFPWFTEDCKMQVELQME